MLTGKYTDYTFTWDKAKEMMTVADKRTSGTTDGTDRLYSIESFQFSDNTYSFETMMDLLS